MVDCNPVRDWWGHPTSSGGQTAASVRWIGGAIFFLRRGRRVQLGAASHRLYAAGLVSLAQRPAGDHPAQLCRSVRTTEVESHRHPRRVRPGAASRAPVRTGAQSDGKNRGDRAPRFSRTVVCGDHSDACLVPAPLFRRMARADRERTVSGCRYNHADIPRVSGGRCSCIARTDCRERAPQRGGAGNFLRTSRSLRPLERYHRWRGHDRSIGC